MFMPTSLQLILKTNRKNGRQKERTLCDAHFLYKITGSRQISLCMQEKIGRRREKIMQTPNDEYMCIKGT